MTCNIDRLVELRGKIYLFFENWMFIYIYKIKITRASQQQQPNTRDTSHSYFKTAQHGVCPECNTHSETKYKNKHKFEQSVLVHTLS